MRLIVKIHRAYYVLPLLPLLVPDSFCTEKPLNFSPLFFFFHTLNQFPRSTIHTSRQCSYHYAIVRNRLAVLPVHAKHRDKTHQSYLLTA
ncbi:hypothetical protein F4815DRAFT_352449 [Daldinia loculata]|nr:hypothetical protein F4815DRAFT_352449 [Daldinia loculata]